MSAPKLSSYLTKKILPILKSNLRDDLNKIRNELEIDPTDTINWLMSTYNLDKRNASSAFDFIIKDIMSDKRFVHKKGVPGKPYIFYPKVRKNSYDTISRWKKRMGKRLSETKYGIGEEFSQDFHLGHGASSLAAVQYRAVKAAQKLKGREGVSEIFGVINKEIDIPGFDVETFADTVFTKRAGLKRFYDVRLKLEAGDENIGEAAAERAFNKKVTDAIIRMAAEAESSPKPLDIIDNALDSSLRGKPIKSIKSQTKVKASVKNKNKPQKGIKPKISRVRDSKGRFSSPISLMNLINARLHDIIRRNMKSPALVYRSGRFARSVKITNISQTRQNQMTAFYTYMKSPYQTFERGYAQGSVQRDPRLLISKSIREAASQVMGTRFDIRTRRQ